MGGTKSGRQATRRIPVSPLADGYGHNLVLLDKITPFQGAIEAICASDEEMVREIRDTAVHEVAHHFGIDDERLEEMER